MLFAGSAKFDITPRAGTHLCGGAAGEHRPAQVVLDPLHVRATVFVAGEKKLCFLAFDSTIVTEDYTPRIRRELHTRFGFDPDAVLVHAIQTHSAPTIGHMMFDRDFLPGLPAAWEYLRGGETAYYDFAAERAVTAVEQALLALRPVEIGAGTAVRDDLAFNRRGVTRAGKVCMPWFYSSRQYPLGPTHIRYLEGPVDPEVGVFAARDEQMRLHALLLHFTCHPVNVFATQYHAVSADWPGAWAAGMQPLCGTDAGTPLVLNGCCGDVNPWPPFTPDFVPDHRRMGAALTETGREVLARLKFTASDALGWRRRAIAIPLRAADPERLTRAEKMLAAHPEPLWSKDNPRVIDPAWFQAGSIMSAELVRRRSPLFTYEVQAFRIGDTGFVGLPGEPFAAGQLAIKLASPFAQTFVAHATTQYVGYVPTAAALPRGGHEADFSFWSKLAPDALERIVATAGELLRELQQG